MDCILVNGLFFVFNNVVCVFGVQDGSNSVVSYHFSYNFCQKNKIIE